jgi:hypothetical protein
MEVHERIAGGRGVESLFLRQPSPGADIQHAMALEIAGHVPANNFVSAAVPFFRLFHI